MEFVLKKFKEELIVEQLANIHYFEFTPSYHTAGDRHEFCELLYVDRGSIRIVSDHYTGDLCKNQLILHGENQRHALVCDENIAPNIIIIGFECHSKLIDRLTYSPLLLSDELQVMLAEIIKEARLVYMPPYDVPNAKDMKKRADFPLGADQLIKDYLQIFLLKCLRLQGTMEEVPSPNAEDGSASELPQIYEIKRYIDDNYCHKINVEELCFLFHTNKTSLSREFKLLFGTTIIDYVNTLRIKHAKSMLREGGHTLTEISDELGLSSVHYLSALFKKYVHTTPTEYLHSIKKNLEP